MKAIILAAGKGERMKPLTNYTPKALLTVKGKPLIHYQVEKLVTAGIHEMIVNHAKFGEQIEASLGNGRQFGAAISYSPEGIEPLETAGGIIQALAWLGNAAFVVVNADVWSDFPFSVLPKNPTSLAHLILVNNPDHHPQGDFALANGILSLESVSRYTYSGIGVYRPELFSNYPAGKRSLGEVLRATIPTGKISGELYHGVWVDVGTPERLQALQGIEC